MKLCQVFADDGYLKLMDLEQAPAAEPLADDAATLPLDLLLADAGYEPRGANLFLLSAWGASAAE